MYLDAGAVYADVLQVGIRAKPMEDLLDQAAFRPPFPEPLVHRLPRFVPHRQIAPRRFGQSRRCHSASPGAPVSATFCRHPVALENTLTTAPTRCLSTRIAE